MGTTPLTILQQLQYINCDECSDRARWCHRQYWSTLNTKGATFHYYCNVHLPKDPRNENNETPKP